MVYFYQCHDRRLIGEVIAPDAVASPSSCEAILRSQCPAPVNAHLLLATNPLTDEEVDNVHEVEPLAPVVVCDASARHRLFEMLQSGCRDMEELAAVARTYWRKPRDARNLEYRTARARVCLSFDLNADVHAALGKVRYRTPWHGSTLPILSVENVDIAKASHACFVGERGCRYVVFAAGRALNDEILYAVVPVSDRRENAFRNRKLSFRQLFLHCEGKVFLTLDFCTYTVWDRSVFGSRFVPASRRRFGGLNRKQATFKALWIQKKLRQWSF